MNTKAARPLPDLTDELWTNAHLLRYFACGSTKLVEIKKDPDFPPAVLIAGLQRYPAARVKAYVQALLMATYDQDPIRRHTTTFINATPTKGADK